jgi:hypothetical protein
MQKPAMPDSASKPLFQTAAANIAGTQGGIQYRIIAPDFQ